MSDLFERPLGDWTDAELEVGVRVVARRRDELAGDGCAWHAGRLAELLELLVDERDRRTRLYREMASALAYAPPSTVADLLDDGWGG